MRMYLLIASTLLLTGCPGGSAPIDSKQFLNALDGPKVPSMQDAQMEAARNAEKKGNFDLAAQIYGQILEKHPEDKEAQLALADSYRRNNEFDRALAVYENLLAQDPKLLAAKEGKGLVLISKGDFETPGPLFEDILKDDPTRWKSLNALGILFSTRSMNAEAQQYFNEALKHHPDSPSIYNNLGLSLALDKNYEDAIRTLTRASNLAPTGSIDRKRIDLNLALVHASAGHMDQAQALAEQYLTGAVLNNNLGLYAHLAQDDQLAKTYLNMALTDSKVYYDKAWNNLKGVDNNDSVSNRTATVVAEPEPVAKPKDPSSKAKSAKADRKPSSDRFSNDLAATAASRGAASKP